MLDIFLKVNYTDSVINIDTMNKEKRNQEIIELYNKGVKKAKIATYYGLSRERIAQILKEKLDKDCGCAIIPSEE